MSQNALELAKQIERTNHSANVYEAAFGDLLGEAETILDVGAGDSLFQAAHPEKTVVRVDAQYGSKPDITRNAVAGLAQELPFRDDAFDATITAFAMQHLPEEGITQAIKEMARVTKKASGEQDPVGIIGIFPVFDPEKIKEVLKAHQLQSVAAIHYGTGIEDKHGVNYPTLVIHNREDKRLQIEELAQIVEVSGALKPHKRTAKFGAFVRRLSMQFSGDTRRSTNRVS